MGFMDNIGKMAEDAFGGASPQQAADAASEHVQNMDPNQLGDHLAQSVPNMDQSSLMGLGQATARVLYEPSELASGRR